MATLLLSQGVPILLAGDPTGHTRLGNDNAYCQDNEIGWLDWHPAHFDNELLAFVQSLTTLRKDHPVFRRRNFFQGRKIRGADVKDIIWLTHSGKEMTGEEWNHKVLHAVSVFHLPARRWRKWMNVDNPCATRIPAPDECSSRGDSIRVAHASVQCGVVCVAGHLLPDHAESGSILFRWRLISLCKRAPWRC